MLNKFRNATNSFLVKAILISIAAAFVLYGVGDVIRGRNEFAVVKFTKLRDVTLSDFRKTKAVFVKQIQQVSNQQVTPELMEEINLDKQVIDKLILDRILSGWVKSSGLIISDNIVMDYVKNSPNFQDAEGKFSLPKFKDLISKLYLTEDEYFRDSKQDISLNFLQRIITETTHMPKFFENIVVDFLSEKRKANIIKVKLDEKGTLDTITASEDDLKKFFEENTESFKTLESRKVSYIVIQKSQITSKSQEEADQEYVDEITKIEDFVAAGDSLAEIAAKYKSPIKTINGDMRQFENSEILSNFAEQIFAMNEKDVSYPEDKNDRVILFEIDSIKESVIPQFSEVKSKVNEFYLKRKYVESNIAKLKDFESKSQNSGFVETSKEFGYKITSATISRSSRESELPDDVVVAILNTDLNKTSNLILIDDYAYIVNIQESSIDKAQKENIKSQQVASINNRFKGSVINSLISYYEQKYPYEVKMEIIGAD